jgi:hypothetical protein
MRDSFESSQRLMGFHLNETLQQPDQQACENPLTVTFTISARKQTKSSRVAMSLASLVTSGKQPD